ncbi:hypothetical protein [Dysgonomonas capnocytophagoides]|uniref:hypothetical protein n=1 Tax=Dysgonomonas capnocytophagoides TaxID=45254 RepID=UPI003342E19E
MDKPKYIVERVRSIWTVYDSETGSKISGHITYGQARAKADELNNEEKKEGGDR